MDILINNLPLILSLLLPSVACATAFSLLRRRKKEQTRAVRLWLGILTGGSVCFGAALICCVIALGGSIELILPMLLLPFLIMLI